MHSINLDIVYSYNGDKRYPVKSESEETGYVALSIVETDKSIMVNATDISTFLENAQKIYFCYGVNYMDKNYFISEEVYPHYFAVCAIDTNGSTVILPAKIKSNGVIRIKALTTFETIKQILPFTVVAMKHII